MNVSLISLPVIEGKPEVNIGTMKKLLNKAIKQKPDLVCFPEMSVVTDGYPYGQYRHLAQPIPGKYSDIICGLAQEYQVHIALGLLEQYTDKFYSSAILINTEGQILLRHRQVRNNKPYSCGDTFNTIETSFGTVMFAICADIWDKKLLKNISKYKPNYIIVPADICGDEDERNLINCNHPPNSLIELKRQYIKISKQAKSKVLIVNCYNRDTCEYNGAFGGAFVFENGMEIFPSGLEGNKWKQPSSQPIYNYEI